MSVLIVPPQPRFIVIRRDNIGDLVCTTPLIRKLRERFQDAHIAALVNSYNEPVLENNPDVDAIYAYTKAKHRPEGTSVVRVYWDRWKMLRELRRQRFDFAVIASTHFLLKPLRLARQLKPRHIVGFVEPGFPEARHVDVAVPYEKPRPMHLVEELEALLHPFGIDGPMPSMRVVADPAASAAVHLRMAAAGLCGDTWPLIGVHISARKLKQRWPAERFVALMRTLHQSQGASFMLFWSPGDENNPLHPGDDAKALSIMGAAQDLPLFACPTHTLKELIAGLAQTNAVICADGGAMHVAAALDKPIVCLFGNSDASVWYPWGVPHELLQKSSRDVNDISVEEVVSAWDRLARRVPFRRTA